MAFLGRKVCTLYPQRFCQWPAPTECPVAEGKGLRVSWSPFHHGGHYLEHWSCSVDAGEVDGNSTTLSSISTEEHRTQAAQAARHTDSVTLRREFLEDCGSFQHCCGVKLFVKEGSTQSLLEDLKILAECRRRALPGGHRRVFRTRTSLTWSMPTGSTSSAGTGNPPAHPGPWSLCPTEPGSTVAAMMSWRGCWWGSGCWCSPMTTCLKNMLIFLAFVNMRVTLLPEEFPGAQPVVGSVKSRVRSGREALAASMSLPDWELPDNVLPGCLSKEFPPRECFFTQNYSRGPEMEILKAFWCRYEGERSREETGQPGGDRPCRDGSRIGDRVKLPRGAAETFGDACARDGSPSAVAHHRHGRLSVSHEIRLTLRPF
ncbi:monoglyceride lipase isoform X13 [Hippopotamus amphibius kiboko]|uniref:monoglyceride lipase isoform X13 n=1 Tax=Hippopotamus amphibius kiboko TaxID=575201 RepID=UPI0025998B27|nr:monoglyceride lipase isoform X13 [Hippopotamus amphibius kiboko]